MANNIKIGFQFTPANQLKSELDTLLNNISKNTKLDFKINFNDINKQLDTIRSKLQNGLNLDGITKSAYSSAKVFENELNSLGETIGKLHQKSDFKLNTKNGLQEAKEVNKALEEQYNLTQRINSTKSTLQSKLNTLNGNGFINPSVLQSIQTELNGITSKTPQAIDKLNGLKQTISNLGSSESSIVRIQNKITQMTSALNNLKSKGLINTSNTAQVQAYEQQLERLKNILVQLQNGKAIGGATITNELNNMTNASRNLNASLQTTSSSIGNLGRSVQSGLASMRIYVSTAMLVRRALNEIKEGFNEVVQVEDSLVGLQRIYTMTNAEAQNLTKTISDQALAMGTSTTALLDLTTSWKKLGYSIEDAQTMAKNTQMFNLAGDIKNEADAQEYLVSIMKGFNIQAEDSMAIIDRIDSANNNFAVSSKDVGEALKRSSSALSAFGNDLPSSIAMVTRLNEVLQDSATTGQSLKSIASRLTGNSTATSQLEELGISLNDSNGKLKSTYDLIKEIGAKLESMPKNAEYAQILSNLFGARQIQAGSVLLDKYNQLDEVINKINSDSGIASKEYEMRMNSTSAKLQQMKQTINQVWEKSISSDFTKGLVEGVTQLIKVFGNLPTVIGLATTALMLFKGTAIKDAIVSVISFTGSLITASSAVGATAVATDFLTLAMNKLKLAFASNPLGLIAIVATTAIVAFASLHKSMQEVTDDIVAQGENVKKLQDSIDDLESKQARLNELNSKTELNNDEKKELVTLNNQLAETYPELISQYNTESGCFEVSADSLQKLIDKKRENAMMENAINLGDARKQVEQYQKQIDEAMEQLSSGKRQVKNQFGMVEFESDMNSSQKQELMNTITEAQENISKLSTTVNQGIKYINDYYNELIKGGATTEEATSALEKLGYTQNDISYALSMTSDASNTASEKIKLLVEAIREINAGSVSQQTIERLNEMFPELGINSENASEKINVLKKTLNSLDDGTNTQAIQEALLGIGDSANEAQSDIEELQKAFNGFSNTKDLIKDVIEEMEKYGGITEKTYGKVLGNTDVINALKQNGDQIENLNNLYEEQTEMQQNTIDKAFEQTTAITNCEEEQANSKVSSDEIKQESDADTNTQIQQNASDTTLME